MLTSSTTWPRCSSPSRSGRRAHGGHQQLALDRAARVELADLDDLDQLEQLLDDLLERRRLDVDDDRDPAEALVLGRRDGEREDVEVAPGEQAGDPGEHAGPVLDEDRQDVVVQVGAHRSMASAQRRARAAPPPAAAGRTRSSLPNPAGTIGNTFSRASTRKSTTTGRSSIEFALSIAGCDLLGAVDADADAAHRLGPLARSPAARARGTPRCSARRRTSPATGGPCRGSCC